MGQQCDGPGCQAFGPAPNHGWLVLGVQNPAEGFMAMVTGQQTPVLGTFCSMPRVANWAYVAAVTTGPPAGAEPPSSGTGWPG